jgi:hypothetical protein
LLAFILLTALVVIFILFMIYKFWFLKRPKEEVTENYMRKEPVWKKQIIESK